MRGMLVLFACAFIACGACWFGAGRYFLSMLDAVVGLALLLVWWCTGGEDD
jgi:hypothetical protein